MNDEQIENIEKEEEEIKELNNNNVDNDMNENINESGIDKKLNPDNTRTIQITIADANYTHYSIDNAPRDITVDNLKTLMINSSEFHLKSKNFLLIEDDIILFDNDFIRDGEIKLVYNDDSNSNDYFLLFLVIHLFPICFYIIYSYPIELSLMLYLVLILFYGLFLRIKRDLIIKQARSILKKVFILIKLINLFFYSMLPFFNADNLDEN